ncbi:hypothetical protein [Streptomyces buecherae]|uniref:hypothetical protein n=1 Tax=Streptomyces buecherae TaxID=2763006 RepID=UPI0037A03484
MSEIPRFVLPFFLPTLSACKGLAERVTSFDALTDEERRARWSPDDLAMESELRDRAMKVGRREFEAMKEALRELMAYAHKRRDEEADKTNHYEHMDDPRSTTLLHPFVDLLYALKSAEDWCTRSEEAFPQLLPIPDEPWYTPVNYLPLEEGE